MGLAVHLLNFWFGFLWNVFGRSLKNYPIQNCFKYCYVKDDCVLLRGSYNIQVLEAKYEGDSGVPHTFEGQGHKI